MANSAKDAFNKNNNATGAYTGSGNPSTYDAFEEIYSAAAPVGEYPEVANESIRKQTSKNSFQYE